MFQFSAFAYRINGMPCLQHGGLPHSEIRGSIRMCRSPRLIAACRVLPRLWEPRHPPCALIYFLPSIAPFAKQWTAFSQYMAETIYKLPLSSLSVFFSIPICQRTLFENIHKYVPDSCRKRL